jgi:hypothetical protein
MTEENKTLLDIMADDVKAIREALIKLEKVGINKELMILYVHEKSHVNKTMVKAVLEAQMDFLKEAFKRV